MRTDKKIPIYEETFIDIFSEYIETGLNVPRDDAYTFSKIDDLIPYQWDEMEEKIKSFISSDRPINYSNIRPLLRDPPSASKFRSNYCFVEFHRLRVFILDNFGYDLCFISNLNYRGLNSELWSEDQPSNFKGFDDDHAVILLKRTLEKDIETELNRFSDVKGILSTYDYFDYEGTRFLVFNSEDLFMRLESVFQRTYFELQTSQDKSIHHNLISRGFPYFRNSDFQKIIWKEGGFKDYEFHPLTLHKVAIYVIDRMFRTEDFKKYYCKYIRQNIETMRDVFRLVDGSSEIRPSDGNLTINGSEKEENLKFFDFLDVERKERMIEDRLERYYSLGSDYIISESEVKDVILKDISHLRISDLQDFRGYSLADQGDGNYKIIKLDQ